MPTPLLLTPATAIGTAWLLWAGSWLLAAGWQDRAVRRVAVSQGVVYRVLTTVGGCLLAGAGERYTGGATVLWRPSPPAVWGLTVLVVGGLAFTWWARVHLGRLWSSAVTEKAGHHVVDTGPYGLVRHPIYSGVSLAALATAAARGTVDAAAGTALLILGFYVKARVEEGFLRAQLGPAYDAYARRVGMLVPFRSGRP